MNANDTIRTNAQGLEAAKLAAQPTHTPGPYHRCQYGYLYAMVPSEVFGMPAQVSRQVCNVQQTENPADVALLQAAPDMLEALRICVAKLEENGIGFDAFKIGSAAIAKATGAQS